MLPFKAQIDAKVHRHTKRVFPAKNNSSALYVSCLLYVFVCFCQVTLRVYSPVCLCVILAGNWVLLIFVWGCRMCFNTPRMHIKPLYELSTCLPLRSPSSSLASCRKLSGSITKMTTRPLPSPHLVPSLPVWWQMALIWCVCQASWDSENWGESNWWGYFGFHTPQGLL